MKRMAFAVVVVLGWCATPARADTLPLITGVPGTYTPGQTFSFQVSLPFLLDLNAYTIELIFSTGVPQPNLLAFPTVATAAPGGQYVVPSNSGFGFQFNADPGSTDVVLSFSDSATLPVNTVAGTNNKIATVTVSPGADLTGPITISVGNGTSFNFNPEGPDYPSPEPIVVQQADTGPGNPVPAPPAVVLLGIGGLLLAARRRFRRSSVATAG